MKPLWISCLIALCCTPRMAASAPDEVIACSPEFGPDGSLLPGYTLKMIFTTGQGGHAGSDDVTVNIGTIAVANGYALMNSGQILQVELRYSPTPGPSPIAKYIHLGGGSQPLGVGSCAAGARTIVLEGSTSESVVAIDSHGVPRNIGVHGIVKMELTDNGSNDRVRVFFAPDPEDPNLWAAVSGLVFDVPITRGSVTSATDPTPTNASSWGRIKVLYR